MEINSIKNINFFHSRSKVEQEIFIKKKPIRTCSSNGV